MSKATSLSAEKARLILQRAAEIDRGYADAISIETLRASAAEAGIAVPAFDAALAEYGEVEAKELLARSVRRHWVARASVVVGLLLLIYATLRLFP